MQCAGRTLREDVIRDVSGQVLSLQLGDFPWVAEASPKQSRDSCVGKQRSVQIDRHDTADAALDRWIRERCLHPLAHLPTPMPLTVAPSLRNGRYSQSKP